MSCGWGKHRPSFVNAILDFAINYREEEDIDATLGLDEVIADVHKHAADLFQSRKQFGKSQVHRVAARDTDGLVGLFFVWKEECFASEESLLVLRMVCLLLCVKDPAAAGALLETMPVDWDEDDIDVPLQLAWLLTAAVLEGNRRFYLALRQKFRLVLRRDNQIDKLVTEIGHIAFGIPRAEQKSFLSALLSR